MSSFRGGADPGGSHAGGPLSSRAALQLRRVSVLRLRQTSPGHQLVCPHWLKVRFAAVLTLAAHMQEAHCPRELPYSCGACPYRASDKHRRATS
ncbi:unnamed protein product [Danaus chrysippus]|uniref:(African queen) hypothetical protein n=1 Tax=Danaus chrysippus TaxID=151541 RepID=A0A8J2W8H0_9NEOP|nr:unnamed protein product [Danaus chrysippus]